MKRAPRCLGCGYDLSGLTDGPADALKLDVRCPECDRPFIAREQKRPRGTLWLVLLGNFVAVLAVFALIPQDACGGPGMGYVGLVAWIVGTVTLTTSWQWLETRGYGRKGSAWVFVKHLVAVAIALLFVSLGVAAVKLAFGMSANGSP